VNKVLMFLSLLFFTAPSLQAEPPQRRVIQAPHKPQVVRSQPREFTRPTPQKPQAPNATKPTPQAKPLPKGFGVPIQRPQGFGKQQWQKPQPQPQRPKVETKHSFGFYNYYRPVNPHFRYYRVPSYYPPVIIQPQPMPIYPGPFHSFFFHFRF